MKLKMIFIHVYYVFRSDAVYVAAIVAAMYQFEKRIGRWKSIEMC